MTVINMDCIRGMRHMLTPDSIDAIVTDPPYELGFMGKSWDASGIANSVEMWAEALRVLKPGGHLLAFSGSRTYHRMVCAIEDAGFEIRDQIMWVYGSGFPKSLNVAKAIDETRKPDTRSELLPDEVKFCAWMREQSGLSADAVRRVTGSDRFMTGVVDIVNTATKDRPRYGRRAMVPTAEAWAVLREHMGAQPPAWVEELVKDPPKPGIEHPGQWKEGKGQGTTGTNEWQGWGTALKPAHEPIVVARKPLAKGCTVAANVLAHGTGAINVDGCRVDSGGTHGSAASAGRGAGRATANHEAPAYGKGLGGVVAEPHPLGRWPANLIHDGSDEVLAAFPQAPGQLAKASSADTPRNGQNIYGDMARGSNGSEPRPDAGSAARFFYQAKSSKSDRGEGNHHPTVKPTDLMRYLCRLVTPPGGVVLDPFSGSGSTGKAATLEGFTFLGFELSTEYALIANARIAAARASL